MFDNCKSITFISCTINLCPVCLEYFEEIPSKLFHQALYLLFSYKYFKQSTSIILLAVKNQKYTIHVDMNRTKSKERFYLSHSYAYTLLTNSLYNMLHQLLIRDNFLWQIFIYVAFRGHIRALVRKTPYFKFGLEIDIHEFKP